MLEPGSLRKRLFCNYYPSLQLSKNQGEEYILTRFTRLWKQRDLGKREKKELDKLMARDLRMTRHRDCFQAAMTLVSPH